MKFKGLATMLVGMALTLTARAETVRPLSLEECIRIALEHNLSVQISRLDPQLAAFTLSASYSRYDPTLSFGATHNYSQAPGSFDENFQFFPGSESESDNINGGLNGLLPWGLNYNLGINASDSTFTRPLFDTNGVLIGRSAPIENSDANVGIFSMSQPLLKNFWIDQTRWQIFINKLNLQISELGLRNQIINTVTLVEEAYYNLIFQEENVKVQQKALELAEQLVAENRRRVEVGALAPLDQAQAESQAASSRADLLDAQANLETAARVLKNLLSDDYNQWVDVLVKPTEALLAIPQTLDLQESWRRGMAQRPDLLQARLTIEQQTRTVSYAKNQLFPQLDLVGSYGYRASEFEFSGALGQISSRDNPYYSYGATITFPLANTAARNNFKSAKMTKQQLELQLRQVEQSALILIENSMANARISYERVSVTRKATQYAEQALKAEETKLEKGKSTSFVVLQLQSNLTAARSAEIRALADYNIALARLAQNEGSTLDRRKIELNVK